MKEIITPGNTGIDIKYYNTCPYCGCYYSYQTEDTYENYSLTSAISVLCPGCGRPNVAGGNTPNRWPHTPTWPWQNPFYCCNDNKNINDVKEDNYE